MSGGCWHGYLSELRCGFAYGPADITATRRIETCIGMCDICAHSACDIIT